MNRDEINREIHELRGRKGNAVTRAVLGEAVVGEIKQRIRAGEKYSDIARAFGIDPSAISKIAGGKLWKHVQ
jgi:hypothetical protein